MTLAITGLTCVRVSDMRHPLLPDEDVDIDQGAAPVHGHVLTRGPQPGVVHTPAQDLIQDPLLHLPIVDVVSPPLIPSPLIIPSLTRDDGYI